MILGIKPVVTWQDVMELRRLRNGCRLYMTGNRNKIGFFQQILWWLQNRNKVQAYLLVIFDYPVAFGLVRGNTVTGGVAEFWRGKGLGKMMFEHLTNEVPKPAYLEVLADNEPAKNLYKSLGWQYVTTLYGIEFYEKED